MSDKYIMLDKLQEEAGGNIILFIEKMANKYVDLINLFIAEITKPNSIFTVESKDRYDSKRILEVIFLSLILSSYSYRTDRREVAEIFKDICKTKNVDFNDLLLIMKYEENILEIIKNN